MVDRISDSEHKIMETLWEQSPLSATDVLDRVARDTDWSLPTVKTLLSRLVTKNVIEHDLDGRRFLYTPTVQREDYVGGESQRLIDRLFGGKLTPLVAHLAERDAITEKDIAEIEELLRELKS